MPGSAPLLSVEELSVDLGVFRGRARVVDRVSLEIAEGEVLGLVGESGSGKSMTALAILRLLPHAASISSGRILLDGTDVLTLSEAQMRRLRGRQVAMIFIAGSQPTAPGRGPNRPSLRDPPRDREVGRP